MTTIRDLERASPTMAQNGVGAPIVSAALFLLENQKRIVDLAARYKVPAMYPTAIYDPCAGPSATVPTVPMAIASLAGNTSRASSRATSPPTYRCSSRRNSSR